MKNKALKIVAAVAVIVLVCVGAFPKPQQNVRAATKRVNSPVLSTPTPASTPKGASSSAKNTFGRLPLRFEKNQGQSDPQVQYIAKGAGYTLFLTSTEAVFRLNPPRSNPLKARLVGRNRSRKFGVGLVKQAPLVRMRLSGANISPNIEAANMLPGTVNYLIGNDPKKWHTKVPTFGTVQYTGVYPGIDLVYYGNQRKLEYDFVVNPGGDPKKIAFEFDGATGVALSPAGELKMDSAAGKLTARKPAVYQNQGGQRKPIDGKFVRREGNKIGVKLGNYDPTKPLVIDPILDFSSYLGGSGDEVANAIAVDSQGFSYVTGDTTSVDFPTSGTSLSSAPNGTTISFVTKMNQTGTALVYSTYLGGTSTDIAMGIAIDANGQAYVDGLTSSTDFPATPSNAFQSLYGTGATFNAFLAKLSADGQSLVYSTFLGGTGDDEGTGIAIDSNQNAYLTGYASSSDFPITAANAFQAALNSTNGNAFVARIDTTKAGNSSLIYSTFLGGSSPFSFSQLSSGSFGGDGALSIAVDANQNAFVVGEASSTDFPITAATAFQAAGNASNSVFLTRLDTNQSGANSLVYSTFIGGTGPYGDLGKGVAVDLTGNAYVVGDAYSADFPLTVTGTNSANGKAFVAKFNTNLSGTASLIYSTLVGGSGGEQGEAITVDPDGDAYVGGDTGSTDFPVTADAVQSTLQGTAWNGFLAVVKPDASGLLYGTYLGGSGTGAGDNVFGLALDSHENLYIAGQTDSADFPTTSGAFQTGLNGSTDAFVTEVSGIVTTPQISSISPASGGIGTVVTITGSSFGVSRGSGRVLMGSSDGLIASWSDTQVVAVVSSGSQTLPVQVLQSGSASNTVNFVVTSPTITNITPGGGPAGTQVAITGKGFGAAQGNGRVLLGTNNAVVVSWSDTSVVANVAAGSSSGVAQIYQGGGWSNSVSFIVSAPNLVSVVPLSGPAGTQVTISGSGLGTTQGSGRVMLGTTYGSVVSWSDTQVIATVASGSSSGTASIQQGGIWSNSVDFSVSTPTIATVSPSSGAAGTQVTVSGSGFGAAQANGRVWLGTTYGLVTSWSDTQVVATVANGSATGTAQILQNGVWSNSFVFDTGIPKIASVTPSSAAPGTQVTIAGSNFGANQGTVWLGSGPGAVLSWSDAQIVATVAPQAATGIVRVIQNGVSSNSIRFVVPTVGAGNAVTLSPSVISMVVGETRSIQALNAQSQLVPGLSWTSSDNTVVTLSTDDPPQLTATAAGHVTITAGDSSADVTVTSSAMSVPGALIWSFPGDGSGIVQTIPAVPSYTGVADVFVLQASGSVQAVRTDGTVAWTASVGAGNTLVPDFLGGLVVSTPDSIKRLDGITGQQVLTYSFLSPAPLGSLYRGKHPVAVHSDGTIFVVDGDSVVGIDSLTGSQKFTVRLEDSSYFLSSSCGTPSNGTTTQPPFVGPVIIAGDGYFYMPYQYLETSTTEAANCDQQENDESHLRLARVGTDGSTQKTVLGDWAGYYNLTRINDGQGGGSIITLSPVPSGDFESIMTSGDTGALFTWSVTYPGACSPQIRLQGVLFEPNCIPITWDVKTTSTSTGTTTSVGHLQPAPVLQAQDGTFVGNAINTEDWTTINLAGFNQDGTVKWLGPSNYQALYTTSDGGGVAATNSGQYVSFDQAGNMTGQLATFPMLSWKGAYGSDSGALNSVVPPDIALATSFAAVRGPVTAITDDFLENGIDPGPSGNLTGNGFALVHHSFGIVFCGPGFTIDGVWHGGDGSCAEQPSVTNMQFTYIPYDPNADDDHLTCQSGCTVDFSHDYPTSADAIKIQALKWYQAAFDHLPAIVKEKVTTLSGGTTSFEHTLYVDGYWQTRADRGCLPFPKFCDPPPPGYTPGFGNTTWSHVYYLPLMRQAQIELGSQGTGGNPYQYLRPGYPPSTPQDSSDFKKLVIGIGRAIGNVSAHETGHQLQLPNMECDGTSPYSSPCPNGDQYVYERYATQTWFFTDVPGGQLHWTDNAICAIEKYLLGKNYADKACK